MDGIINNYFHVLFLNEKMFKTKYGEISDFFWCKNTNSKMQNPE